MWSNGMKPCWAQYVLWILVSVAGTSAMLSSCGQTGPLYLPTAADAGDDEKKEGKK